MKNIEVYVSAFFILLGSVFFYQAYCLPYFSDYGPGPGMLPLWITGMLIILAVINLIQSLKRNNTNYADLLPRGTGMVNLATCVGSFLLFMIVVPYVGFTVSSIAMLTILFSRGYKWYWGLGMSIIITGILFFVFSSILSLPLPVNEYGW